MPSRSLPILIRCHYSFALIPEYHLANRLLRSVSQLTKPRYVHEFKQTYMKFKPSMRNFFSNIAFRRYSNCFRLILEVEEIEILINKIHGLSESWLLVVSGSEFQQLTARLSHAILSCTLLDFISVVQ